MGDDDRNKQNVGTSYVHPYIQSYHVDFLLIYDSDIIRMYWE